MSWPALAFRLDSLGLVVVCNRLLGGAAFVMMVQTAHFTNLDHLTFCGRLYSSGLRGVFAERQVSSPLMVISSSTP